MHLRRTPIKEPSRAPEIVTQIGDIVLENVCFAYDELPILKKVSIRIERGKKTALVGPSGSGKSTIARLLLGLVEPSSGTIRIDGRNIEGLDVSSLRSLIAVVSQDTGLFNRSIAYNVAYADDSEDGKRIGEALSLSQLEGVLSSLPDGPSTRVGERGVTLSGGERQRLAIARALYRRSPLLIMDEATSALDTPTEQRLLGQHSCIQTGCHQFVDCPPIDYHHRC